MPALLAARPHVQKAVLGFGLLNPVFALPQVYKVWALGSVGGLSLITLSGALTMACLMTTWGIIERSATLWGPSSVWIVIDLILVIGVLRLS